MKTKTKREIIGWALYIEDEKRLGMMVGGFGSYAIFSSKDGAMAQDTLSLPSSLFKVVKVKITILNKKILIPREAKTSEEICRLLRDNKDFGDYTFMVDEGHISIWEGDNERLDIPRKFFDGMVDFYEGRPKPLKSNKKK